MPTLEQVHQQIINLLHKYIFYTKKEIDYLPEIMTEGEHVLALTSGFMDNKTWLAVCTNTRVLFLDKGMFFGLNTVQMAHDHIQSIDSSYGILFGAIRMWDGATSMTIRMVLKSTIDPFVRTTRQAMENFKLHQMRLAAEMHKSVGIDAVTPEIPVQQQRSAAEEIRKLAELHEQGYLTREEFEAQKQKLLG